MNDEIQMLANRESLPLGPNPENQTDRLAELSLRLQEEIGKRERAESISRTIFEIAANVNQVANLDALYRSIHQSLANIIDVTNFFIALYDKDKDTLTFPYFVDEMDSFEDYGEYNIKHVSQSNLASAEVIRTGRPFLIQKKEMIKYLQKRNSHLSGMTAGTPSEVWLGVPLKIKDKIMGVICTQSYRDPLHYTEKDIEVLVSVSDQVAIAIDRKRADEEAQKRAERLMVLNRIGNAAANAHDLEKLMESIYEEIKQIFKPDCFFIGFIDQALHILDLLFLIEDDKKTLGVKLPLGQGLSSKVVNEKKPLIIPDFEKEKQSLPKPLAWGDPRPPRSWVGVPLLYDEQIIGVISLQSYRPFAWNEEDLQLFFTIADQITATIHKARLYEAVQQELNERKKAEEEKKDLEIRLRQAQKMEAIGTLAGGIAHDFNNVLYPIIGFAELSMDIVPKEGEVRKNLNEILVAAERAKDLVQQILTFSRQQEIKPRPLQVQPLLKEALKLIRATIPSNISMIQNIDEHCGPILADPSQIHQIIMNLCTNAYHAMRQQGGVLEISLAEVQLESGKNERVFQCAPGQYLCLIVRDTGDGIDSKIIDRIFDPYFTTKPPGEGTGMGLAMVHGIVKSYGGEITVASQTGQGTRFKIYLPRLLEKMIETVRLDKKTGLGQGERVLFIDDEDQVIRMVKQMLERLGYEAVVKKDSAEALEEFRRHPDDYDLVITDQTMPKITGLELSKELLKIRADIPIILCTGFSEIINAEQAQAAGIRKFIMKPIAKKALAQIIRETLDEPYCCIKNEPNENLNL